MTADVFGCGVDDDVSAILERSMQEWRAECIVDDERQPMGVSDRRHFLDIDNIDAGVAERLDEERFGLAVDGLAKVLRFVGINKVGRDSVPWKGVGKEVVRAAIERSRRNDFVTLSRHVEYRVRGCSRAG